MSLTATDRDAQIMELRMSGVTMINEPYSDGPCYFIPDSCSLTWWTPENAWSAAIFCAQQDWFPYGDQAAPQDADLMIQTAVGAKKRL